MTVIELNPAHTEHHNSNLQATFARTTPAGPVVRRPRVLGARARHPGEVPVPMQIVAYRRGQQQPLGTFDQIKSPTFQDVLSEPGAGTVVLANDDPDLAWVTDDALLMFELHGYAAFTMLPRELSRDSVPSQEEAGALTTVTGPGHLALLEEALVYPSRGLRVWPIEEDRLFSWPSVDYNDTWWQGAWSYSSVYDHTPAWYGIIPGWPAGVPAQWIGAPNTSERLSPAGKCYVRSTFHVASTGTVTFWCAADDLGTVYIDGQQLLETDQWGNVPDDIKTEKLEMTEGDHTIAIVYENGAGSIIHEGGPFNPSGVVIGIARTNPDGSVSEAIGGSAAGWRILAYPENEPGMTPGEAMIHCIDEAKRRGVLNTLRVAFDGQADSGGAPWPITGDIATKVGTDLLTFFRELAGTYVDMAMAPGSTILYAWSLGQRGEHSTVSLHRPSDPAEPFTGNLGQLQHKRVL